jgi:CRP-like cAMP-binding protein
MPETRTAAAARSARIRAVLMASTYFRGLPQASIDDLAGMARIERFRDGQSVQAARPIDPRFFVVLSGALRMLAPPSPDGSSTTLAVVGPGGFYGAGRFLAPDLTWPSGQAVGDTELAVVAAGAFRDALRRDPAFLQHISGQMIRRYNATMALFADVVHEPLPQRLARRLVAQILTLNRMADGAEIEIDVTQAMLAEMLGVSRSRISAELRSWHGRKIIRLAYRRLFVLDRGALCRIAGPDVQPF